MPKLTEDLVYAEVAELPRIQAAVDGIGDDFTYGFYLKGKFLENYSFKVISFSHDIAFYPIILKINSEITKELGIVTYTVKVESPEELESLLRRVLKSERLSKIVGGIIKLSKT